MIFFVIRNHRKRIRVRFRSGGRIFIYTPLSISFEEMRGSLATVLNPEELKAAERLWQADECARDFRRRFFSLYLVERVQY